MVKKHLTKDDALYSVFGVFCFASTLSTIYLTHDDLLKERYSEMLIYIYEVMLVTSCIFMLYVMWSLIFKHHVAVSIVWNFALFFMMVFTSSLFLMLSKHEGVQLMVFTMNIMILFHLCIWKIAFFITVIGFSSSYYVYIQMMPEPIHIVINYHSMIYVILLSLTMWIGFVNRKKKNNK